jgi:hypothetical protein
MASMEERKGASGVRRSSILWPDQGGWGRLSRVRLLPSQPLCGTRYEISPSTIARSVFRFATVAGVPIDARQSRSHDRIPSNAHPFPSPIIRLCVCIIRVHTFFLLFSPLLSVAPLALLVLPFSRYQSLLPRTPTQPPTPFLTRLFAPGCSQRGAQLHTLPCIHMRPNVFYKYSLKVEEAT